MSKATNDLENTVKENLEYIGLNLKRLPTFLKEYNNLNYRPSKSYDYAIYKVYKYINIKNIEILITPTDRLTDLKEKYKLSSPICEYLDSKKEENVEKFADFMKMLSSMNKSRIEEITKEQEKLNENIPYKVKYSNNFIWQIYYSDYEKKFFMLVTTNEQDNNALFYLLKQKIANSKAKKGKFIFVPISHMEYSGEFLTKSEIADIENYLWYFTKEWPNVYEIYDKDNNLFIKIVGTTNIYDKIKSTFCITLYTKEDALKFYKLLKAMFILATSVKGEYTYITKISEDGELEFWDENNKIEYDSLSNYIRLQYLDNIEKLKSEEKERNELKRKLGRFKEIIEDLTQEYLVRQKQIATFLECKKSFFGKVRYFFKKKKDTKLEKRTIKKVENEEQKEDKIIQELYELKEQYTIEDLINISTKLEEVLKENNNLSLDIKALENKKDILSKKIDNADLYIKEIDKHKKSIFEFWKFTSKDEMQTLSEAEENKDNEKNKVKKYFNYETDLEDLGQTLDELQRRKLSKNETDAIFAIKQVPNSFKELEKQNETDIEIFIEENEDEVKKSKTKAKKVNALEKDLTNLKKEYKKDIQIINAKDFDIFGSLVDDHTKIKTINNIKHREIEKDKYKVLNFNLDTDIKVYTQNLENYLSLIKESLNKIKSPYDISVYCINNKKSIEGINLFNINPIDTLKDELTSKKSKITMCKLNIKEGNPAVFYTNIIFYDNFNKTLPIGMNLSSEVLIDVDKLNVGFVKEENFYINYEIDEFEYGTKQVLVYEYDVE